MKRYKIPRKIKKRLKDWRVVRDGKYHNIQYRVVEFIGKKRNKFSNIAKRVVSDRDRSEGIGKMCHILKNLHPSIFRDLDERLWELI